MFPTSIRNGTATHEIPFGAIERPQHQEYPAQNWIDYGDGAKGLTVVNRGLPGNNVTDGKMMLSLMRSARLISYGYVGGYEPGVGSDTGLGLEKKYTLDYAVVPHAGDWRAAAPWRQGLEFNNPLIARTAAPHHGELPARWGLLEVSKKDVVTSALKSGRDGSAILRVYEAAGTPAVGVRVTLHRPISRVQEANLIEDPGNAVDAGSDGFSFDLRPFEIKTFKLTLTSRSSATGEQPHH